MSLPNCPKCDSAYTYEDRELFVCPECANEWTAADSEAAAAEDPSGLLVRDSNGTLLADGDTVTVIKDLKLKGSSGSVKVGTKVTNIKLIEGDHDIDCKIKGFGAMRLKSEFVRKA